MGGLCSKVPDPESAQTIHNQYGQNGSTPQKPPELKDGRILTEFVLGDVLGKGAYGIVYECKKIQDGAKGFNYAVKFIDKHESARQDIDREVELLQKCKHPTVTPVIRVFREKFFVCIVMNKMAMDLITAMTKHWGTGKRFKAGDVVHIAKQMFASIAYIHGLGMVHRDVKADNFLVSTPTITDHNCSAVLSDFGFATVPDLDPTVMMTKQCGTRPYWAPEIYQKKYTAKVDEWALGVVMYGLLMKRFPFNGLEDVSGKQPKLTNVPEAVQQLIGGVLDRNYTGGLLDKIDKTRLSASAALNSGYITSGSDDSGPIDQGNDDDALVRPSAMREPGADVGMTDRRQELVDRLREKKGGKSPAWAESFNVLEKSSGKKIKYRWICESKLPGSIVDRHEAPGAGLTPADADDKAGVEVAKKTLDEYGIPWRSWHEGDRAKTIESFATEIQRGDAVLMLDATEHRKLVRVVDVVCLRLSNGAAEPRYVIEAKESYDDQSAHVTGRLPASKKQPHENVNQAVKRICKQLLNLDYHDMMFNLKEQEVFDEKEDSPSYPGLLTVYHKTIVEAIPAKPKALNELGGGVNAFNHNDVVTKRQQQYQWLTEQQCTGQNVKIRAPAESGEISGLVPAPIVYSEDEVSKFLQTSGIDIEALLEDNPEGLKELSRELVKELVRGESTLMINADGRVLRVVDVALLYLVRSDTKQVLVQLPEHEGGGYRLPGGKRRPDENPFRSVQRFINKHLALDSNCVALHKDVVLVEEETVSPKFNGLVTVYRKRIIRADATAPAPAE